MANQQEEARPVHGIAGAGDKRTLCGYRAWRIKKTTEQGAVTCQRCQAILARVGQPQGGPNGVQTRSE